MSRLPLALFALVVLALGTASSAHGATTKNFGFNFENANYRNPVVTSPGAYQSGTTPRTPCAAGQPDCKWESHEFTIAPGEQNGQFKVAIKWGSADDDWDLYVYKVLQDDSIDESRPVASSAQGGTTEETATLNSDPDAPIPAGKYRIIVDNWAAPTSQEWEGFTSFAPYVPGNKLPISALVAPDRAAPDQVVTLDASGSRDPDGSIANYAWDIDGDGRFEVDGGTSATLERAFAAGRRNVGVRVRDNKGGASFATRTIEVAAAPPTATGTPASNEPALPEPLRRLAVDVPRTQKRTDVLRRGLAATAECPRGCRIVSELRVAPPVARRLGLGRRSGSVVVAKQSRTLRDRGFARLRLKVSRRSTRNGLRRVRSANATLTVTITPQGERPSTFTRAVTIVR